MTSSYLVSCEYRSNQSIDQINKLLMVYTGASMKILDSTWIVNFHGSPFSLKNTIMPYLQDDEYLTIINLTKEQFWYSRENKSDWLRNNQSLNYKKIYVNN